MNKQEQKLLQDMLKAWALAGDRIQQLGITSEEFMVANPESFAAFAKGYVLVLRRKPNGKCVWCILPPTEHFRDALKRLLSL